MLRRGRAPREPRVTFPTESRSTSQPQAKRGLARPHMRGCASFGLDCPVLASGGSLAHVASSQIRRFRTGQGCRHCRSGRLGDPPRLLRRLRPEEIRLPQESDQLVPCARVWYASGDAPQRWLASLRVTSSKRNRPREKFVHRVFVHTPIAHARSNAASPANRPAGSPVLAVGHGVDPR